MFCEVNRVQTGLGELSLVRTNSTLAVLVIPTDYYEELSYVEQVSDQCAERMKRCRRKY